MPKISSAARSQEVFAHQIMAVKNGVRSSWEDIAARKRSELADSIPPEWRVPKNLLPPESQDNVLDWPETSGWFTAEELAITSCSAQELLPQLASGKVTSEDVTKAFCKRACAAQQLVRSQLCRTRRRL